MMMNLRGLVFDDPHFTLHLRTAEIEYELTGLHDTAK